MGHDVIYSQQSPFKDYECERAAQHAKKCNREHQNDGGAENVGNDLAAPFDSIVVLRKVSQGDLPLLQGPDIADDA